MQYAMWGLLMPIDIPIHTHRNSHSVQLDKGALVQTDSPDRKELSSISLQ